MRPLVVFFAFVALSHARPQVSSLGTALVPEGAKKVVRNYIPNEYEREQNQAASYQFSSDIDDKISDLTNQRMEEREGLAVKGMYSYSDGYYKRTVHYAADENGYRILGMEAVPLDGPHIDLSGTASVQQAAHGTSVSYKVQSVPVEGPVGKVVDAEYI